MIFRFDIPVVETVSAACGSSIIITRSINPAAVHFCQIRLRDLFFDIAFFPGNLVDLPRGALNFSAISYARLIAMVIFQRNVYEQLGP